LHFVLIVEGGHVIEDIRLLIELQGIDSAIVRNTEIVEAIPGKVSSVEQPLREAQSAYEKLKQNLELLAKKKKAKEGLLDDVNEKIRKLKARTTEIKTNKEYQALLKEIESGEKERNAVEDEILILMESIESCNREVSEQREKVGVEDGKREAFKRKLEADAAEVRKELDELRLRRESVVNGIDRDIYSLYFKVLEGRRGLAVVEARDEVCQGCNMNMPPQLFVEIKKNEKIFQCPQCSRILYWKG
jgi:predicted  nucleic acid-binding Zn-ribbon protein